MFNNSLMNSSLNSYGSPSPMVQDTPTSVPPSFLFGNQNKRRSVALSNTNPYLNASLSNTGGPSTDIFASPIPSHVKDNGGGSGKSVHWSPALVQEEHSRSLSRISSPAVSKGPPLRSLREEVDSPAAKQPRLLNSATNTPSKSTQADTIAKDHWVTVFGFPPNFSDKVLMLMGRHGEIVSQQFPSRGNWVHIRYSCVAHAQQALARNACLVDGCVRIGVVPCTDQDVVESSNRSILNMSTLEEKKEDENRRELPPPMQPTAETSFNGSFLNNSIRETSTVSRTGSFRSASRAGMRSLASGTPRSNDACADPQKQEGLIGRFWSLVGN